MNEEALSAVNRWAVRIALAAILLGLLAALLLIWGPDKQEVTKRLWQLLGTASAFFVAAAATLCTIKYFYVNRDSQRTRSGA
jgi:hypothetical protein